MAKRLTQQQLQPELEAWARDGLVDAARIPEILQRYPSADAGSRIMAIFVGLGVVSLLAGVALIIGANWQDLDPLSKIVLFLGLLGVVGWWAIRLKSTDAHPGWWESACSAWAVLPLLGLAMVSQIFHTDGRVSQLLAAWLVLILPLPLLTRSRGVFSVFLIGLFFAVVVDLRHYLPASNSGSFFRWYDVHCSAVILYGLAAAGASQAWRFWQEDGLLRTGEYLGVLAALGGMYAFGFSESTKSWWVLLWAGVVAAALLVIMRGVRAGDRPSQVNAGFVTIGLVLLSIYLRLVGTMMDTALVFFTGGAVLLGLGWILHRLRKFALAAARPAVAPPVLPS